MNGKKVIIRILFVLCLFFVELNQAVSSENNITNYRETISVLQEIGSGRGSGSDHTK